MIHRKTETEIEVMREANRIVSDVHRLLMPLIKPGTRVSELDALAEDFIRANGARPAFKGYGSGSKSIPPFPGL